jgi:Peptidase family M23
MMALYLLQALVPVALIGWLAFAPPRSVVGFWVQALGIAISLVAISMTGIWAFPPWWTPYVFGAMLIVAVIAGLMWQREREFWPTSTMACLTATVFAGLTLWSANETRIAVAAQQVPDGRVVDLASPLGPGTYVVANGGSGPSINAHATFLDQSIARHRPYWGTGHGVDLIAIDRWGFRTAGLLPVEPDQYVIFGRPVVAPCAGDVIAAVDGLPDMQVPQVDRDHLAGNHVILRCSGVDILLGHFRRGTVLVRVGAKLSVGDAIAQVGNSGNTSEPHLHVHAQEPGTADAPFSGAPIPIRINDQYLVRNDRFVVSQPRGRP